MADQVKEQDNKDQESGRPVQLDPEKHGGTPDEAQPDQQGTEHHQPPSQQPAPSR
jgi:hypothetical protein